MSLNRIRKLNDEINGLLTFDDDFLTKSNNNDFSRQLGYNNSSMRVGAMINSHYSNNRQHASQYYYSKESRSPILTQQTITTPSCDLCLQLSKQNYQLKRKLSENNDYQQSYKQTRSQLQALQQLYELKCKEIDWHKTKNAQLQKELASHKQQTIIEAKQTIEYLNNMLKNNNRQ